MSQARIAFRSTRTLGIRRPVRPSVRKVLGQELWAFLALTVCFWSLGELAPKAKILIDDHFSLLPLSMRLWTFMMALGWTLCVFGILVNMIAITGRIVTRLDLHQARARNRSLSW